MTVLRERLRVVEEQSSQLSMALRIKDQVLEDQNQSMRTLREDVRAFETREREQETRLQALTAEHDKFIKCADVITGDLFV